MSIISWLLIIGVLFILFVIWVIRVLIPRTRLPEWVGLTGKDYLDWKEGKKVKDKKIED